MQKAGRLQGAVTPPVSPASVWSTIDREPSYPSPTELPRHSVSSKIKANDTNRTAPILACLNCRPKKVKCQLENGVCRRCLKLGLECFVPTEDERRLPCSKKVIRELQNRIRDLESELSVAHKVIADQNRGNDSRNSSAGEGRWRPLESPPPMSPESPDSPLSLLARLCSGQWQLNRDSAGQLRFFGPTSSLHVTESVSSSILKWGNIDRTRPTSQWQALMSLELQNELLEIYWTYQHPVLQVVHKNAFLEGMTTSQSQYYSELLLCCIFACAARMSDRAEVRALSLSGDDVEDDEVPFFVKTATTLLEVELRRPSITTVQSLLLLSVMDCAQCNDTKGWLYAGDACRLAFDLGLHRDCQYLTTVLSPMDLEVRNLVFWGCFVFDRLWALYLGRPHCIRLCDISIPQLPMNPLSGDIHIQMAAAWSRLLEIVGHISESLNGNNCTESHITDLVTQLQDWLADLPPLLQYHPNAHPTIHILHMQYSSAQILLHRPTASFGTTSTTAPAFRSSNIPARQICITNAVRISQLLTDYQTHHGSCITMSGVALHTIATAATTLIANIVESKNRNLESQCSCLRECIRSLMQLEKSYYVTRRVRKIIQIIMRLLNLELTSSSFSTSNFPIHIQQSSEVTANSNYGSDHTYTIDSNALANMSDDGSGTQDLWELPDTNPFRVEDFMFPVSAQSTQFFLSNFEPVLGRI